MPDYTLFYVDLWTFYILHVHPKLRCECRSPCLLYYYIKSSLFFQHFSTFLFARLFPDIFNNFVYFCYISVLY